MGGVALWAGESAAKEDVADAETDEDAAAVLVLVAPALALAADDELAVVLEGAERPLQLLSVSGRCVCTPAMSASSARRWLVRRRAWCTGTELTRTSSPVPAVRPAPAQHNVLPYAADNVVHQAVQLALVVRGLEQRLVLRDDAVVCKERPDHVDEVGPAANVGNQPPKL